MTKKLFVKNIHIKELNNLKMEATPITAEHKILQAEYYRQQKRDLAIDNIIERINIGEFVEKELFLNDILPDFKFLLNYRYPYESKGNFLKGNLQFTKYVQKELKKGRCRASLLIELI